MQKRILKYIALGGLLLVLAFNSVYFKNLDEVKAASTLKQFDAAAYARHFMTKKLLPNLSRAVDYITLTDMVTATPDQAFQKYSHALGIGNVRYFLVKGEGVIKSIDEDAITLAIKKDTATKEVKITTEFIYGNAIRDASGLININEFSSTMDFNNVSAEINKIIRTQVVPPFKAAAKPGDRIRFTGALELNQAHINLDHPEIVPIELKR